jgi:hypothetical protein
MPEHAFVFLEACICAPRVFWHLIDFSQVLECMQLMWRLPSLSDIGAVTTLSAAASAAAVLILFFRASFPAFSLRLVAAAAITMRRGLPELCEGAMPCPDFWCDTICLPSHWQCLSHISSFCLCFFDLYNDCFGYATFQLGASIRS